MVTLINKISEFAKQKEQDAMIQRVKDLEKENSEKHRRSPREIFNLLQKENNPKPAAQSVPGVIDI